MAFVDSITLGDLNIIQVDADPAVSGVTADIGSFAVLGDGSGAQIYQKFGVADLDWKRVTDDSFLKSQSAPRTYYVAKNGDDVSGDGSVFFPFLTVKKGLDEAALQTLDLSNTWIVKVGAGGFLESPMTLPANVKLVGEGVRNTSIIATNQNSDLITSTADTTITDVNIIGPSNAANYAVRFTGDQPRGALFINCSIVNSANGIIATSTVADFKPIIQNSAFVNMSGTCLTLGDNCDSQINDCRFVGNGTTTRAILTQGTAKTAVNGGLVRACNIGLEPTSSNPTTITLTDLTECTIPLQKLTNAPIKVKGTSAVLSDALVAEVQGLSGYSVDEVQGEQKLRVFDELSVGIPGQGRESVFGEGDSYTNGMLVYTFNGSTFTDVTEEASTFSGSTFSMPGTAVNNAIYVSTQRLINGTTDPVIWFGIKQNCTVAASGGEIVAEYWNGSAWIEFNHLSTDSGGQYFPYAKQIFQRVGSEQIRFNDRIDEDWALNDPVSFGTNLYWVRFRVASTLSTAPVFEQFKVHTNRTEINDDGYIEYFGKARPFATLPFDVATFIAANASPQNSDVYFGDNLGVGRIENLFQNGTTDRSGFVIPFPEDLDTSCPVVATFYWSTVIDFDAAPDYDLTLRWSNSIDGDTVGNATSDVPTTAPRQQTLTQSVSPTSLNEQFSTTFELDVSDVITRRATGTPDLFWCTIQRDNDGNFSEIALIQCAFRYTKRTNGGHL